MICIVLMLAALPVSAFAASEEEQERICDQIASIYRRTLAAAGADSLRGYCGIMAGWELYLMGITTSPVIHNGNDMYDILKDSDQIAEGYTPVCYPAKDYSLEEALNAVSNYGTKDVYNLIVGFQWTNTEAGQLYGHVTVIHAILDGKVYFTEGFITRFQSDPSQAMICTIPEFADSYNSWTRFDGLIHFDSGIVVAGCDSMACDLFVAADTEITLLTKPDFLEAEQYRAVPAGERLYASALCRNSEGVLFYRIMEENRDYYIPAGQVKPVWLCSTQIAVHNGAFAEQIEKNNRISGILSSEKLSVSAVAVCVTDQSGKTVLSREYPVQGTSADLSSLDMDFSVLPEGVYTLGLYCDLENPYCMNGEIIHNICRKAVSCTVFSVGDAAAAYRAVPVSSEVRKNGWQYENENWYYYEDGICRTGWFCDNGIDYYLLADGAAATGWQEINGKIRYFSETGAMRIGWLETGDGTYYMLSNGAAATGLTTVGDNQYFFDENGLQIPQ